MYNARQISTLLVTFVTLILSNTAYAQDASPALLSAFFGLDNALPFPINRVCPGGANLDGMPVNFSHPVDPATLQPEDFAVTTESGAVNTPRCVTLAPALDIGEMRTVLLIGELGDAANDPPLTAKVVGDVLSGSGDPDAPEAPEGETALNFIGAQVDVTPLEAGPFIVDAESVPHDQWVLDVSGQRGQGSGCPSEGLVQIVRVIWAGGVTKPGGDEIDDLERAQYQVALLSDDNSEITVTPYAIGDLDDGDNYHELCLDVAGDPVAVAFAAGYLVDPNDDTLNPDTRAIVEAVAPSG